MAGWLVVGLGNPGPTYAAHRHNAGKWVVQELARRAGGAMSASRTLRAEICQARMGAAGFGVPGADAQQVILMASRTFMNNSGVAVAKTAGYYSIKPDRLIVVHDELDLDLGRLKVKFGGGDNGHNGLKSIRQHLGSGDFYRVRFGIGRPPGRQEPADFVLSPFPAAVREDVGAEVGLAADAVEALIAVGLETAQNQFNN